VLKHLNLRTRLAHEQMMQCIELEHEEPTTVNEDTLSDYKSKFLAHYRAMYRTQSDSTDSNLQSFISGGFDRHTYFTTAVSNLGSMGFSGLKRQDFLRLLKPEDEEEAMDIMAECRAYYQSTRFLSFFRWSHNGAFSRIQAICRLCPYDHRLPSSQGLQPDHSRLPLQMPRAWGA
jgi:hypothetical protein